MTEPIACSGAGQLALPFDTVPSEDWRRLPDDALLRRLMIDGTPATPDSEASIPFSVAELSRLDAPALKGRLNLSTEQIERLIGLLELARRIACQPLPEAIRIDAPEVVFGHLEPRLRDLKQEVFLVLTLSSSNRLIRIVELTRGILNSALVHPREVFREALTDAAAGILVVHNHPSGDTQPSGEDRQITRRLVEAGELMNIPVLDHIIIGGGGYYSFREAGVIS